MTLRLILLFVLALSINIMHAQEVKRKPASFAEKMRPTLMKVLGEEWTVKLIGDAPVEKPVETGVILPPIPKVSEDARSTAVYDKKADKVKLPKEQEEKYYVAFVKEMYEAARLQKPNEDEISKMSNILAQGGTREGVYHMIVLDSVYGGMENYEKYIKSNGADFMVYFYQRYLNKKISKENLKGMNIYSAKRIIADKALDVIDAFGDKREDLENWYAVLSADLASKFPQVWTSKLRKETDSFKHKHWASQVPVAHIKSEVLIKLHMAMNSMM